MVNPGLATRINHIKIDEKGQKWEAGSDHSLIEITMKGYKQKYKLSKENMWNINANTKWQMQVRKLSNLEILYLKGIKIGKSKGYRRKEIKLQYNGVGVV